MISSVFFADPGAKSAVEQAVETGSIAVKFRDQVLKAVGVPYPGKTTKLGTPRAAPAAAARPAAAVEAAPQVRLELMSPVPTTPVHSPAQQSAVMQPPPHKFHQPEMVYQQQPLVPSSIAQSPYGGPQSSIYASPPAAPSR